MKNLTKRIIGALLGLSLVVGVGVSLFSNHKNVNEVNATYNQSVNEYYSSINWDQTGATLKTSLFNKIKITTAGWSYDGLWEAYKTTDVRPDGTHFWDIYSDTTDYTLNDKRINASYKKEGDSINREHVIPQSSFNEAAPMKSDIHHVLPSDGYVNNRRSAYPHGIVTGSPTYTSNDGCKLGSGTGSTTVFEPMDNYKGDIARIYFYFVTCYQDKMSSNSFSAFDKSTHPSIKTAYLNVYLQWAKEDPVSEKEIIRNNAAYAGQGNRNPFIDSPYAVGAIWDPTHASDYGVKGQYTSGEGVSISKTSASMISGGTTTISATSTGGGTINWTTSNSSVVSLSSSTSSSGSSITLTAGSEGSATITASSTISGKTYSQQCSVTVSATKQVSSIAVSGQKTTYNVDDTFVKPTVTATYNDGTQAEVSNEATYTGYDMSVAGDYTVTVSYSYGGVTKTAAYAIKVKTSGGGGSGEEVTLDIDFTGSKSSDTDIKGNVWSTTGSYTTGSGYLRLNSSDTYISNSPELLVDTAETMSVSATLRTYGGVNSQSLRITAYNENETAISNTLVLSPTSSSLSQYSGTLTFTSSTYHEITIKAYSGNNNSLGISGMSFTYTDWVLSPKTLTEIGVSTAPTKTSYVIGEKFDPTGLVISRTYSDDTSDTYTYAGHTSEFSFDPSPVTPLTSDDDVIQITYGGQSCFFNIELTSPKVLDEIAISGYTTSFTEGDPFVFGGTVTAYYADGSDENVTTSATYTGYDMASVGNQTVTVSFGGQSKQYSINVSAGTLSSIAVSEMTTTYVKDAAFAFDGVCTATFANGYQKAVTPSSVSSPDMSTGGVKTVTVSYTYNGNTRTTTYDITVNSYRPVYEETYSVIGTIVYTSGSEVISVNTLSTSKSGYTNIENAPDTSHKGIRLGSGSNKGTLTITSTSSNIYKVVVNARTYNTDSPVSVTIGGTSYSFTTTYSDYTKEYTSATNSVAISTTTNGKRAWISTVTVYTKSQQDIGQTEDCLGLESFITNYMHMDYVENLGYCADSEHHYYTTAKAAFNALNTHQRSLFTGNDAYNAEWARLSTWASKNGDSLNSNNELAKGTNTNPISTVIDNGSEIIIVVVISVLSLSMIGVFLLIKRRKEN